MRTSETASIVSDNKISKFDKDRYVAGLKQAVNGTVRPERMQALTRSTKHLTAMVECRQAMEKVRSWGGTWEELEAFVVSEKARITALIADADASISHFPVGSIGALGNTTGIPVIDRDLTLCHFCPHIVHIRPETLSLGKKMGEPLFLAHTAGSNVLLFASHESCWEVKNSEKSYAAGSRPSTVVQDRPKDLFRVVPREEWLELILAQSVLST